MKYYLAVFSSITFANRIKKRLDNYPGFITLMHTPSEISDNGCSYSLRFKEARLKDVINEASNLNIKIKSIYIEENNRYKKINDIP